MGEFWAWARTSGDGASIFRILEPYRGAIGALALLARHHRVVILTTKPKFAVHDTSEWFAQTECPPPKSTSWPRQSGWDWASFVTVWTNPLWERFWPIDWNFVLDSNNVLEPLVETVQIAVWRRSSVACSHCRSAS